MIMTQYIDKAAVVAEITNLKVKYNCGWNCAIDKVLEHIDDLKVKEVNLDTVMEEEYDKYRCYNSNGSMLVTLNKLQFNSIATHFFELGIRVAQKGE